MVYDPQFSPEAAELFFILTGQRPPEGKLATLLAARDALLDAAQRIDADLTPQVAAAVTGVLLGMVSGVSVAFATSMEPLTSAPPYYLPSLSGQYRQLAEYSEDTGDQFLQMKVNSIVILASLLVAIAIDLVIAYFQPEIGLKLMTAEFIIVRFLLNTLIGQLLRHLALTMVMSVAIQEALDVIDQLVLDAELHQSWNWDESLEMLEVGALGGALGIVLLPLDRVLGAWLGHMLVSGADLALGKTFGVALGDTGKDLIQGAGHFATGAGIGGVHNAFHSTLFQAMRGEGWSWDWGAFAGGAAQGVTAVIGGGLAGALKLAPLPKLTVTMPADELLTRGPGGVNPGVLNDIASAPAHDQAGAVTGPVDDKSGGGTPAVDVKTGEEAEPPVLQVLRAAGVPAGPDTAYQIALRTGYVPTLGEPPEQNGYWKPVLAQVPMSGYVVPPQTAPELPVTEASRPGTISEPPPYEKPPLYEKPEVPSASDGSAEPLQADSAGQPWVQPGIKQLVPPATERPAALVQPAAPVQPVEPVQPAELVQPVEPVQSVQSGGQAPAGGDLPVQPVQEAQVTQRPSEPTAVNDQADAQKTGDQAVQSDTAQHSSGQDGEPPAQPASGTHGVTAERPEPGRPVPGQPAPSQVRGQESGQLMGAPQRPEVSAAGTRWTRDRDGWYVTPHGGAIERGPGADGKPSVVDVPEGSRAVFDGSGELRLVVLPGGVSYERGLDGAWSSARERQGEVVVVKIGDTTLLPSVDGKTAIVLSRENEVVLDNGIPVAYRQVRAQDGRRLPQPRVFLPDPGRADSWTEHPQTDQATYEAWLASANQAHEAARLLHDVAARSGPQVPENQRLMNLDTDGLRGLLAGSPDDAAAAIYEWVRRREEVSLRWTQMSAAQELSVGHIVNMAAGEGKSWLFLVDAARQAALPGVDSVHVITTRSNLADREFEHYVSLLTPMGYDVHRMNSDALPPAPRDGRPTIYVGTSQDVAFTDLKTGMVPGQKPSGHTVIHASVDEIDEAFVYSNTSYILSEGVGGAASEELVTEVTDANTFLTGHLASGGLTKADFGRTSERSREPVALTETGLAKAAELLGRPLSAAEQHRLNMAATAHLEYVQNIHYVVYGGKIYIIDQTTHEVLYNPETATESRWNGGLAQAVEAKHGLTIRDDPSSSKTITAQQLYAKDIYGRVTGASGTANGKGQRFAEQGLSDTVTDIPLYFDSRLLTAADHVSSDLAAKLDAIAEHTRDMRASAENQPQLILAHRNDLVAGISSRLTDMGVTHTAIDAEWFLDRGANREAAFKAVVEQAGKPGQVLVINMQGARGVDIPVSDEAKAVGGLHVRVTTRSGVSRDIDIQAEKRAARSGDPGSVSYYLSPDDDAFELSRNPNVELAVVKYTGAFKADQASSTPETRDTLAEAEHDLRALVPALQTEGALRMGLHSPYLPNAPPAGPPAPPGSNSAPAPPAPRSARPPRPPGDDNDADLPKIAAGRSGDGARLMQKWAAYREQWQAELDQLAGNSPPPNLDKQPEGFPPDRPAAYAAYAQARLGHEEAGEQEHGLAAARLSAAEHSLAAWGITDPEGAWRAAQQFSAARASGLAAGRRSPEGRDGSAPGAGAGESSGTRRSPETAPESAPEFTQTASAAGGQPDAVFSLGQVSEELAGFGLAAVLAGQHLGQVAAAIGALPVTAITGIGQRLVALPPPQRALAASSLTAIQDALSREVPVPESASIAADRLVRLLTALRWSPSVRTARYTAPQAPAAAPVQVPAQARAEASRRAREAREAKAARLAFNRLLKLEAELASLTAGLSHESTMVLDLAEAELPQPEVPAKAGLRKARPSRPGERRSGC